MRYFLTAALLLATQANADPLRLGLDYVTTHCAGCHAVTEVDHSPNPRSIPFRFLGRLYPIESLEEALAEGIAVSHEMPEFELEADQISALIGYLESIQVRSVF